MADRHAENRELLHRPAEPWSNAAGSPFGSPEQPQNGADHDGEFAGVEAFSRIENIPAAHPQIREVAIPLARIMAKDMPAVFSDIEVEDDLN